MTKVKICGITTSEDVAYINVFKPDFAGFVMFFPKSKRNLNAEQAKALLNILDKNIKAVAVVVSPTVEQLKVIEACGFDFIQIHGQLTSEVIKAVNLPVIRAFNVSDMDSFSEYLENDKIYGFVFDSQIPGSGKVFDWTLIDSLPKTDKPVILAGGLNCDNVGEAINKVNPYGVDVSSGVENESGVGKSREKIEKFIRITRN